MPETPDTTVPNLEKEPTGEHLEALPEALGFIETPELRQLKRQVAELMSQGREGEAIATYTRYQELGESVVTQLDDKTSGPQIGLDISLALVWRAGGDMRRYRDVLGDCLTQAWNADYEEVAAILRRA